MAAGVESDFDSYVRASGPRLKRLAYLLTADVDTAEDLLQTAYARVLPRWRRVSRYDNPDAYVRRVMVSIRTSWWRQLRGREVATGGAEELRGHLQGGVGAATARDVAVDASELDAVLRALRTLPRRQQVAVVLRHYCDLSEAETADVMGISVGGVKSQTSKGLAALRLVVAPVPPTPTAHPAGHPASNPTSQPTSTPTTRPTSGPLTEEPTR